VRETGKIALFPLPPRPVDARRIKAGMSPNGFGSATVANEIALQQLGDRRVIGTSRGSSDDRETD